MSLRHTGNVAGALGLSDLAYMVRNDNILAPEGVKSGRWIAGRLRTCEGGGESSISLHGGELGEAWQGQLARP